MPQRRAWLIHLVDAAGILLAVALLMGYEIALNKLQVPATWISVAAVGLLGGPKVRDAYRAWALEQRGKQPRERLLPEAEAALKLGPLMREHGHIVLLELEELVRRRALEATSQVPALPPGRRHVDGQ